LTTQASTESSAPQRRNENVLLAASLASIQENPDGEVSCVYSAGVAR
jgi:hypothetical protein